MEGGPPTFRQGFTCPALLEDKKAAVPVRGYHPLWPAFPDGSGFLSLATGLVRVRSPLLTESRLMSFPPVTEMVQFTGFASPTYVFSRRYRRSGGFPHSEISGSKCARHSPELIATCYVLHRLSTPRHPPDALLRLNVKLSRTDPRPRPQTISLLLRIEKKHHACANLATPRPQHGRRVTRSKFKTYSRCPNNHPAETVVSEGMSLSRSASLASSGSADGRPLVEVIGFEPTTFCLQSRCSPS